MFIVSVLNSAKTRSVDTDTDYVYVHTCIGPDDTDEYDFDMVCHFFGRSPKSHKRHFKIDAMTVEVCVCVRAAASE